MPTRRKSQKPSSLSLSLNRRRSRMSSRSVADGDGIKSVPKRKLRSIQKQQRSKTITRSSTSQDLYSSKRAISKRRKQKRRVKTIVKRLRSKSSRRPAARSKRSKSLAKSLRVAKKSFNKKLLRQQSSKMTYKLPYGQSKLDDNDDESISSSKELESIMKIANTLGKNYRKQLDLIAKKMLPRLYPKLNSQTNLNDDEKPKRSSLSIVKSRKSKSHMKMKPKSLTKSIESSEKSMKSNSRMKLRKTVKVAPKSLSKSSDIVEAKKSNPKSATKSSETMKPKSNSIKDDKK